MPTPEAWTRRTWTARARTAEAAALLMIARLLIAAVALRRWRGSLGAVARQPDAADAMALASLLCRHVERAALRLPMETKCLPRAMALSWMLRRRSIAHAAVFGVRHSGAAPDTDALHAWIEIAGQTLPAGSDHSWQEVFRLGT